MNYGGAGMLYICICGCGGDQGYPGALGCYICVGSCGLLVLGTNGFVGWNCLKFAGMNGLAFAFIVVFFSSAGLVVAFFSSF